jgi:thymidylate synthase
MFKHDMEEGFPLLTTKKMPIKTIIKETIGFLQGKTNSEDLGKIFWDTNANNKNWLANPNRKGEGDLGRVYGKQWREWKAPDGRIIDQLGDVLKKITLDAESRKYIINGWNPGELDQMALEPCHFAFHLIPDSNTKRLNLTFFMRSNDVYHGLSCNIASYALILTLCSIATGFRPGTLVGMMSDVHYYEPQKANIEIQLQRSCLELPKVYVNKDFQFINLDNPIEFIDAITEEDIILSNYKHWPALEKVEMAD